MAKKIQKKIPKYAVGTQVPVTPDERMQYNNYVSTMAQQPGRYVRNWDHNEDFQKQIAQQTGFDYSRAGAIQGDMQSRQGSVNGIVGNDPWGGNPNWVGSRESNKTYKTYEYYHYDKNGNQYSGANGHIPTSTEPLTQPQLASWSDFGRNNEWKSNDQGIPVPETTKQWTPAVAMKKDNPDNFYDGTQDESSYSIDAVRMGKGGWIQKAVNPDHKGYFKDGGKTKKAPIYVASKDDPRYVNYQDSVHAYGLNKIYEDKYKSMGYPPSTGSIPYEIGKNIETLKGRRNYDNDHIHPERLNYQDMSGKGQTDLTPEYKEPEQEVRIGNVNNMFPIGDGINKPYAQGIKTNIIHNIKKIPYSWKQQSPSQDSFHPQQVQLPNLPPFRNNMEWYSNDKLVPMDASDEDIESKLYDENGNKKYAQGGYIHGGEYEVSDEEISRLKKLGYKFDVL